MDELSAALGCSQMERIEGILEKMEMGNVLTEGVGKVLDIYNAWSPCSSQ